MLVKDCRRCFSGSPLLLPCYTCLTGWMSQEEQQRLYKLADDKIWEILQDHDIERSQDSSEFGNVFSSGPHIFLQQRKDC